MKVRLLRDQSVVGRRRPVGSVLDLCEYAAQCLITAGLAAKVSRQPERAIRPPYDRAVEPKYRRG